MSAMKSEEFKSRAKWAEQVNSHSAELSYEK
jgi:hypothetical protein